MKQLLIALLVGTFVFVAAGCGKAPAPDSGEKPAAEEATKPEAAPAEDVKSEEISTKEAEIAGAAEPAAEEAKPEAAAAGANSIIGSTYKIDQFEITFKSDKDILVKGGPIAAVMPDGAAGTYKLDGEKIEVSVLGHTKVGTWNGEALVIDGAAAEKIGSAQ